VNQVQWRDINEVISIAASASSALLALYGWRKRQVPEARWFVGLVSLVAWINFCYIFEAAVGADINAYVTLIKFEYLGLTIIPMFWLGFAQNFSSRERILSRSTVGLLATIPVITIILAFTNDFHGLIWKEPHFAIVASTPVYEPVYGAWFWVYVIYASVVFLAGSVILLRRAFGMRTLYRTQAILVFIAAILPWVSNMMLIFDNLNPAPQLNLNSVFLTVSVICLAFALFRFHLLDITPLAYDTILNNVPDGLLVVDMQDRVLALNQFVKPFLDNPEAEPIGLSLDTIFSRYQEDTDALRGVFDGQREIRRGGRIIDVRISPVLDGHGNRRGRLFVLRDATSRKALEQAQREALAFDETLRDIGNTLNSTLDLNQVLTHILEGVGRLVPDTYANIMMVEPDGYTLHVRQQRGYPPELSQRLSQLSLDYRQFATFSTAAQTKEPIIVPDVAADPKWKDMLGYVRSFAGAPILIDNQVAGFINIDSTTPGALKPELTSRLQILAQKAAIAIKNARIYEHMRQQAEELERHVASLTIIQQMYKDINILFTTEHVLEISLDATLRLSLADGVCIILKKEEGLEISRLYGSYPPNGLSTLVEEQSGIIGQVIASGQPVRLLPPTPVISALPGTLAQIGLPLFTHDADGEPVFVGIILLETHRPEQFTDDRLRILGLIADRASLALENVQLIETVEERAKELETLYGRLSQLEQLKSEMIRIAAHDLKNPLNVVLNYLELLTEMPEAIPKDPVEIYRPMLRSARRMNQIIKDFLSLDRIEKVAQEQTREVFDLNTLIAAAKDEFAARAAQKQQILEFALLPAECQVYADPVQLYEAVTNFISNAIKYTGNNGRITITLQRESEAARVEIRDNGYGIPLDKQDKLFQPFYRARTQETQEIEGTGLGLHLTKNIIERQGGELIFHSVYGEGSMFGFRMPLYVPGQVIVPKTPQEAALDNLD
jgi:signal transduction histidine kinase/PAS domain-containing protein